MSRIENRQRLVLLQLLIVVGFLSLVWFSFGQNVVAPRNQAMVPQRLGTLELTGTTEGSEAITQVGRLHGSDIELVSAYIAEYAHAPSPYHSGDQRLTVWVGRTESESAAAELTRRMAEGIEKGGSGFSNLQQLTIAGSDVFRVDGPGGEHFFYSSGEQREEVVWLSVEAADPLPILEQALENF